MQSGRPLPFRFQWAARDALRRTRWLDCADETPELELFQTARDAAGVNPRGSDRSGWDERAVEIATQVRLDGRRGQHRIHVETDLGGDAVQCCQVEAVDRRGIAVEHTPRICLRNVFSTECRLKVVQGAVSPGALAVREVHSHHHLVDTNRLARCDFSPREDRGTDVALSLPVLAWTLRDDVLYVTFEVAAVVGVVHPEEGSADPV